MFIQPLNQAFDATLGEVAHEEAFSWIGVRFARWTLSGEHYYRLERVEEGATRLLHGERFRGVGSPFIPSALLNRMEQAFHDHNRALKERIEHA